MLPGVSRHRKLVRHHHDPGTVRELTFSCYRRFPLLADDEHKRLLSVSVNRAIAAHGFQLVAFVFMPEHVHLLVFPTGVDADVSALLAAIKKPHSFRVKERMTARRDPWLGRLTIRERPGRTVFRFWQEGTGYDRDLFAGSSLRSAIEYLHANPVRRGLVRSADQWAWSSWHHYHADVLPAELPIVQGMPESDLLT
jgi:putative transposase